MYLLLRCKMQNGYAVYFENTRINDSKFCYLQKFCYASIFTLMYVRKRNKLDIDLTTLHYIHKHYLCHFLYQFSWCSGYHICLTHRRSPVRNRAKTGSSFCRKISIKMILLLHFGGFLYSNYALSNYSIFAFYSALS